MTKTFQRTLLFSVLLAGTVTEAALLFLRIPKSDPAQSIVSFDTPPTMSDNDFVDVSFDISDSNNFCVNVQGFDIATSSTLDLPAMCSVASVLSNITSTGTDNDACFHVAVASGSAAQASISNTTGGCHTAWADGPRATATLSRVEHHSTAHARGEDAQANITNSRGANHTAVAMGSRSAAFILDSVGGGNRALATGPDARAAVYSGANSTARAGENATTDIANVAVAMGLQANAMAVNGSYNVASALASLAQAYAGDGSYNNATAAALSAQSRAAGGNNHFALSMGLHASAVAGQGHFNQATALDISSLAEAVNGEGNTVVTNGMKSHGASTNGSYNQVTCSGTMAYAAAMDGDRNVVSVNGTNAVGTAESSFDSKVTASGELSSARCFQSDRSTVTAVGGGALALVIAGSDNVARAQAPDTVVTIVDSGSYNQAIASIVGCQISISNDGMGNEVQQCQ